MGDSSTKTEHRGDQHPKEMFTTHALFAWKTLLTQNTLHSEEGKGTPCAGTHGRHNSSLRVIVSVVAHPSARLLATDKTSLSSIFLPDEVFLIK